MWKKRKKWMVLLAVELIVLLGASIYYGRREKVSLSFSPDMLMDASGQNVIYLDKSSENGVILTPEFTLPKGLYTLDAEIQHSGEIEIEVRYADYSKRVCYLNRGGVAACQFRVSYDKAPMRVRVHFAGEVWEGAYILVEGIRIATAPCDVKNHIFHVMVLLFLVDVFLVAYALKDRISVDEETKRHIKVLLLVLFVSSLPLMVDYIT